LYRAYSIAQRVRHITVPSVRKFSAELTRAIRFALLNVDCRPIQILQCHSVLRQLHCMIVFVDLQWTYDNMAAYASRRERIMTVVKQLIKYASTAFPGLQQTMSTENPPNLMCKWWARLTWS